MNTIHNRNKACLRKTAAIAATTLIISIPLSSTLSVYNVPGFENHVVSAATLAEVNLLQSTNVTATENGVNDYNLTVDGQALANVELLGPERVAVFQLDLSGLSQEVFDLVLLGINQKG